MVVFVESEALQMLDLYVAMRADPENVTRNGNLLNQRAREELTRRLNALYPLKSPWSESQVFVKFKNLRSEYAELKWLSLQPGFRSNGTGMMEDWWRDVKIRRPKSYAFRGKLPWVFESRMRVILGDAEATQVVEEVATPLKRNKEQEQEQQQEEQEQEQAAEEAQEQRDEEEVEVVRPLRSVASDPSPRRPQHKRKRDNETSPRRRESGDWEQSSVAAQSFDGGDRGQAYGRALERSVEQSAMAAAGMARGFQDLTSMFQDEAARCRALEQQSERGEREHPSLADQRSVLLAIAHSLEHSTRATADMAKGYRELVSAFVREAEAHRESDL